jgi:hypothetical protein
LGEFFTIGGFLLWPVFRKLQTFVAKLWMGCSFHGKGGVAILTKYTSVGLHFGRFLTNLSVNPGPG